MQVSDPRADNRCQHTDRSKQCSQEAMPGFDKCRTHMPQVALRREDQRQYLLSRVDDRTRLSQFAESDQIKSLRDEIAIARMMVEKRFNLIKTDVELLLHSSAINQLLLTIERLVKTFHSMEQSLGSLLGRATVLQLGRRLCEIIVDELQDAPGYEDRIDRLIERLIPALTNETNTNERSVPQVQAQ